MSLKHIIPDGDLTHLKNDNELVSLALINPEVFGIIMNRYYLKLSRYIHRLSGLLPDEMEDVLQNVFIKAYKHLNDFDNNLSFSSWIYRITHNEAIDYLRSTKRKSIIIQADQDEDFIQSIPDSSTDFLKELDDNLMKEQVSVILLSMKEKHRTVLLLKYIEAKNYGEISDILEIPMGTVATLIHRAKEEFKKNLLCSRLEMKK